MIVRPDHQEVFLPLITNIWQLAKIVQEKEWESHGHYSLDGIEIEDGHPCDFSSQADPSAGAQVKMNILQSSIDVSLSEIDYE